MHLDYLTNDSNPAPFASKVKRKEPSIVFLVSTEVLTVSVPVVSNTHDRMTKIASSFHYQLPTWPITSIIN